MRQNDTFVTENGDVEDWSKTDKSKIYEEIKSNIEMFIVGPAGLEPATSGL